MKTIIIAGGTGFLGQVLEDYFSKQNYLVKILTRNPKKKNDVYWNAKDLGQWTSELENIECLINLCGKSVNCRYTPENKKLIYDSRINTTHLLGLAINLCKNPPEIWINSSTATIYEHSLEREMTEENGVIGNDFSMNIAKAWESAFYNIINPKTRKIVLRTSIVFGKKGGALLKLKRLAKLGLGGKQGKGNQKVSWIHEEDFARALHFILQHNTIKGSINISSPKPTTNSVLMKSLRDILKVPLGLPQPRLLLEIGARIIQTETELVLKSRNVIPKQLIEFGFKFYFTDIRKALKNLI